MTGEAGILYTEPVDERMQIDVGSFFGDFMPPELTWLPRAEKKVPCRGRRICGVAQGKRPCPPLPPMTL